MAVSKTKVKELPPKDLSRIFSRVDTIRETPTDIYKAHGVEEEDMAIFNISPASPSVRDSLKEVVMTMSTLLGDLCERNGVSVTELGNLEKAKGKKKSAILKTLGENNSFARFEMTSESTRGLLARCVTIENYKVLNKGKLEVSTDSAEVILQTIPDIFVEWLFGKVQEMSNLTSQEVLGV